MKPPGLNKSILSLILCIFIRLYAFSQESVYNISGELGISKTGGNIYIYLVDQEHFNIPNSGIDTLLIKVNDNPVPYRFTGIPQGTYAIRCVQDLNGNQILDKGLFGPSEPWALSWKGKKQFPPKFEDLSFLLTTDLTINMRLEK